MQPPWRSIAFATLWVLSDGQASAQVNARHPEAWAIEPVWVVAAVAALGVQAVLLAWLFAQRRRRANVQRSPAPAAVAPPDRLGEVILSSLPVHVTVLDRAAVIIAVNDAWTAFGAQAARAEQSMSPGSSYASVCERAVSEGLPGSNEALEGIRDVCEGRSAAYDTEYRLDSRDGEQWFAVKAVPLRHGDGGAVVTHRDITAEKRQEMALRQSEQRFRLLANAQRVLSGRLITAQEDERRRIARELHDDLQQRLALLAMELDGMAGRRSASTGDEAPAWARRLWQQTIEISSDIHRLSHRLHPGKLEALGLLKTVQGHCRELSQRGLRVTFTDDQVPESIPSDVALCAFRVVQEALQNVQRHSGTDQARVTMTGSDGTLRVVVADDGLGFDTAAAVNGGLGLVSMRERLHLLGGRLTIESAPGRGTVVAFEVPLPAEESTPVRTNAPQEART